MRIILVLIFVCLFTSCEFFTQKNKEDGPKLDSVSFTSVDKAPSFKVCDSIFEKVEKNDCFRHTVHSEVTKYLSSKEIKVKRVIDANILMKIVISNTGEISVGSIIMPGELRKEIPLLESLLLESIASLPKVAPAIKRGIPVTSEYTLPIRIELKN